MTAAPHRRPPAEESDFECAGCLLPGPRQAGPPMSRQHRACLLPKLRSQCRRIDARVRVHAAIAGVGLASSDSYSIRCYRRSVPSQPWSARRRPDSDRLGRQARRKIQLAVRWLCVPSPTAQSCLLSRAIQAPHPALQHAARRSLLQQL